MGFKTPSLILLIVGVTIVIYSLSFFVKAKEGFANIPFVPQSSMISTDSPGATTNNPTVSQPQPKDIIAAQQELENLIQLEGYKKLDANQKLHAVAIDSKLKSALQNPNGSPLTQEMLIQLRADIANLTSIARGGNPPPATNTIFNPPATKPTVAAGPPGQITLPEIENLRRRVDSERLRLANLRSENPNMLVRIAQLEKLSGDLGDIISAIKNKRLKLADVPIKPESAEIFLRKLKDENNKLPLLITPLGTTQSKPSTITASNIPPVASSEGLQSLINAAQALKWELEIKVGYDPEIAQRERILNELKSMEKRLIDLSISETPLSPSMQKAYMKKLETLQLMLQPNSKSQTKNNSKSLPRLPTQTRMSPLEYSSPEFPTSNQLFEAQGSKFGPQAGTFPNGEISPDVYIRPGFPMTDSMISHRASAASYNESTVGGLDYKKRVQELCRQIKDAKLGDAKDFGCIANPAEVSSDYSWRGNYLMVCNRLGDTWGGWYPEMFGCPKYDPTSKFKGNML